MAPSECDLPSPARGAPFTGAAEVGKAAVQAAYFVFVALIPLETVNTLKTGGTGTFTFSKMAGLMLFGLAFLNRKICLRTIPAAFWMVAWYLAAFSLSQLWIPRDLYGFFYDSQSTMIQMAAVFLISANLFVEADFRRALLRFYGWWMCLVAVGMMAGVCGGVFAGNGGRIAILGQDPNVSAGFFALGAICIAGDPWVFAPKWFLARLPLALVGVGTLLAAILETGSRGGLIVFGVGTLGLVLCGGKGSRAKRLLIAGVVVGVLAGMVAREFRQRTDTATRLTDAWEKGDNAGRTQIYQTAWQMFLEKPFLGYGAANNFYTLGIRLNYVSDYYGNFHRDTHNLLLAVLTEVGLIGAAPFIAAILYALIKAWRYGSHADDALPFALMLGQIAINTSLTGYHQKLFWIMFAAAVACGLELDASRKPRGERPPSLGRGGLAA
ncbi:MAG: O-antigen ligase family protein [Elusimicrobiota bacterium]